MKTKIKRYSRSVLSVLLSVCILVSCMAVGIVGTEAAKTDEEAVGYGNSCRVKGSWDNWTLHELYGTSFSVTLAGNTDYSFVYIADNNDQFSSNTTISTSISDYSFSRNDNDAITLHTGSAGTYTFTFNGFDGGQTAMKVSITFPAAATWTVVGECGKSANTTNLFGTAWAPTATANDMTGSGTTKTLTKNYVYLTATDTISYKVAQNHAWDVTYPSANATKSVTTSGYYNAVFSFNENTHAVSLTLTESILYSLTVPTVANAVVTATYGTTTVQEGGTLTNLPLSAKVTVTITPDTGYMTNTVTASGCTVSGSNNTRTITLPSTAATSSTKDKTFAVTLKTVGTKKLYFNNNASEYNMVSAYVQRSLDGYEPFGVYPGATMTKLANSDIWVIEIPEDCDKVRFTGDNGQNTGTTLLTISTSYDPPMYTAGPDKASPNSNSTWGKYYERHNEYTVSKGSTLNNSNLFTGIKATFYDYYTDGELSGISAGGNDTSDSAGWLKGIANDEFTWRDDGWKWNPYTYLDTALSDYNKNIANTTTYKTPIGLYFGNLNTTNGGEGMSKDRNGNVFTGWNYGANNSLGLSATNNAAVGLTGTTLARSQIHHYHSSYTNGNGLDLGMFNEDFLSGWNTYNKALATILRSPVFPVSQRTTNTLILDISSASSTWGAAGAVMGANFHNGNTTSGNLRIPMTSLGNGKWSVSIPSGYSQVEWLRLNPSDLTGNAWNYKNAGSFGSNNKYTFTNVDSSDWNTVTGSWSSDTTYEQHTYYEYDSTNGKDNAYITNISKSDKTAQLNYYNNSNKVYSANNAAGFFPFDYNDYNSHTSTDSTGGDVAHDLGFGMKLEIPFTLEAGGQFSDGIHQVFEFSGDDDLWVFVDDHLVLDLGGAHARTEGTIDFATRTVTATNTEGVTNGASASTRNTSFSSWFDNSDADAIHTMKIYYMERGMFDSNLKFGFSFHAIPNQLKTEKKVRTANINQGFFVDNATTRSDLWIDNRTDHQVTWFEKAFRNDDFIITHKLGGNLISDTAYTLTRNRYVGSSAPATTYTSTAGTVTDGTYKLHNDDVAYFKGAFSSGALMTISETDDNTGGHYNQFEYDETVDVYDDANVDSENNSYKFTTVSGTPTVAGTVSGDANSGASFLFSETASTGIENLNIRTRFTNQMQSHDLRITKVSNVPNDTTDFTVNVKFNFDNQDAGVQQGYIAYPLWCEKIATDGTSSSVQLSATGDATLKPGEILVISKVPENARVQVSETLATSSNYTCTGVKIYDASGNVLDFHEGASSSTSGTNVTKSQSFTVGDYDMVAEVNNEVADPVTISHSLHPDSTGTGTTTVSVQVKDSTETTTKATYPDTGTASSVTVDNTYIKRGSSDKLVITLNTTPDSPSYLEHFYEAIQTKITQLAASGTPYTATINEASGTATIKVNVSDLFDSTTGAQLYTTLPFYSKLLLPTYNFNITKTTNVTTTETFDFEVYKKTGLVYEKITVDPGFTYTGDGTGAFSNGTLTLSPGKTAKFTATHGDIYQVVEVPKGTTVFDYNADGSSVSPTSGEYAIDNGFTEITVTGNTTVTLANKNKSKTINLKKVVDYTYSADPTFPVKVEYYTGSTWATVGTYNVANDGTETSVTLTGAAATAAIKVTETSAGTNYNSSLTAIKVNDGTATTGMSKEIGVPANGDVVTINNYAKKANVSIVKALTGSIDGDNTEFPITVKYTVPGGTEQTVPAASTALKGGQSYLLENLPVGTTIKVSEGTTAGYTQGTTTYSGVTYNSSTDVYTVTAAGGSITVNNSRDTHSFTIKKETDINNTSDEFKIKVYTKDTSANASAEWVQYTAAIPTNKGGGVTSRTAASVTGEYTITKDETLTITGLKANTQVKVVESGYGSPKYAFGSIAAAGTDSDFAATPADKSATTTLNADKGMVITNNVQTTSVTINKVVTGGVTGASVNFPLSVKVTNEKTGDTTTTYTCGSYTLTNGTANANVKINGGQTLTIANVPIGATVEVEELDLSSLNPHFTFTSIDAADANVTGETKSGQKVSFKTANASAAAVTVTNAVVTHNVTITKALSNSNNSSESFSIDVAIKPNGNDATATTTWNRQIASAAAANGSLSDMAIKNGESIIIYNVPEGASVTVSEDAETDFTCQSIVAKESTSSDIIDSVNGNNTLTFTTPADNSIVTVTNKINNKTFTVEKVTDSGDGTGFGIKVEYKLSNSSTWVNYAGSGFTEGVVTLAHNGTASVTVPSDAQVRITETTVTSGYQFVSISDGTNTYTTNGKEFAGNAIANGGTITVNNRKLYQVTIKKNLTSSITNDPATFTFNYSYTDMDGNAQSGTSTAIGHNGTFNLPDLLPAGTQVTITENAKAGYTNNGSSVTANITKNGNVYTVNGDGTITFNNSLNTKTIKLNKVVDYEYANDSTFPVKVEYKSGSDWIVYGTYDVPKNGSVDVTLTGVATTADIRVTETSAGNNYDSDLTKVQIGTGDLSTAGTMTTTLTNPANNTSVTFYNYAKKIPVTVKKVITNFVTGDTTSFPITATYKRPGDASATTVGPNSLAHNGTFSVGTLPVGTEITVTENLSGISGYTQGTTEYTNGLSEDSGTYIIKTDASGEQTITVNNRRDTAGFTIKKVTDVNNTADSFKIKIWTSPNGTDWTAYTSAIGSFTADTNNEYTIHKNSELTVEGLMANTYIKVQETDGMSSKYTSAVTGFTGTTLETGSDDTTGIVKIGGTGQGINITNTTIKKDIIINKNVLHFANSTDAFNVNVLLNSEEAASKTYSYTGAATGTITNGTTKTGIELKHDGTITIKDVPIGTTVTVTEQAPTGRYEFVDIDTANANVTTPATTATRSETFVTNNTANNAEVTIKNDVKTHDVVITKSINNSDNDTAKFKISATVQPLGASDTAQNSWDRQIGTGTRATGTLTDMEITNGQSITIYGVPVDAKVTVTEGATANFTAVSVNGTAGNTANFIMPDENKNVAVVNKINNKQVVIKKVVEGEASNTDTFPIKVEVKANTSGAEFVAYTGAGFDANGKILLAADNTDGVTVTVPLDAEVKVTELTSDADMPTGYTIDKITLNSGTTDVRTDNSYTYTDQQNGTVTVHNKRVQGSIKVTKKISGDKYLDPDFAITVTYQRPADSEPQTHTFTVKGNGDSSGLFELPYGTVVSNVSEASVAGYKLVDTDPIQYKVNDGTAQAFGSGFTVTNQPVEIIVTNELTKHTVTIQKEVVNASNDSISDSTDFTVSYKNGSAAAQTGTINKGNDTKITVNNVPYGTTFTVSEINIPRGYELKSITGNGNVTVTGNTNITVTNTKLPTYSVKVTKNVDGAADATKFGVRVQTDGTPYTYAVNGGTATTVNNGAAANVELADTEYVIVSGLLEGEKLTVTETNDGAPNYSFDKFIVNGTDEAGTEKSYEYTVTTDNDQNIIVNNKEAAKYQYEVTYKYEGYSATTYNSDGTPKEGPQRSFKASGELSAADWTGYFGADGDTFVSNAKAMEFFSKTAPYEDDFMMDLEWETKNIQNMNVDRTNRKVTFEVTATTKPNRTVYVYFQLPYDVNENLVATGTQYNTTNQQHEATTQYGNWVKPHGSFVSAPLSLEGIDGTYYFRYWQIRSTTAENGRNKGKVETNYKKCFYADFNMTMYQDSYVTAVYTKGQADYNPSARSYEDTANGEARINFIENSRNQWNSGGAPDLSKANQQAAGDRIYSDFLLTFGYQDLQLNTLNSTNIKTGFVVEKVAELDTGTLGYETKTQSEYHHNDKYGSSEAAAKTKVEDMVKAGKTTDTGVDVKTGVTSSFIMNVNVDLKQLDNKNQMKYSLNMKNKEYATNGEPDDPYRKYVFRAYTYIKNGDTVVVSDPTYFTIYDMASIEPKV